MNDLTLTIKGLFGHFDYEIPLYGLGELNGIPMSDGVTILTGPNGYGKSTILHALEAISTGELDFFANLKFEELAVCSNENKKTLTIKKTNDVLTINEDAFSIGQGLDEYFVEWDNKNIQQIEDLNRNLHAVIPETSLLIRAQRLLDFMENRALNGNRQYPLSQAVGAAVESLPYRLRCYFGIFGGNKTYEPLVGKLALFRKILNRRFHTFKRVEISREYGLRVRDIGEGVIPLDKLSSGEQETLVLYYQLIFETAQGTMLLIDEPEISLHIAWQRTFIDELKEIVRLNQLRAVVATHSASIIGRHRDIQVDLGALYQDELERQEELRRQGA